MCFYQATSSLKSTLSNKEIFKNFVFLRQKKAYDFGLRKNKTKPKLESLLVLDR